MFSFLAELFGKHRDVRELERLLRECGLHPRLVSDAVKFAVCKWIREAAAPQAAVAGPEARNREEQRLRASAAELLAFCILGHDEFAKCNPPELTARQDARIAAAAEGGNAFDADLIMLTLHAGTAHPDVADSLEMVEQ